MRYKNNKFLTNYLDSFLAWKLLFLYLTNEVEFGQNILQDCVSLHHLHVWFFLANLVDFFAVVCTSFHKDCGFHQIRCPRPPEPPACSPARHSAPRPCARTTHGPMPRAAWAAGGSTAGRQQDMGYGYYKLEKFSCFVNNNCNWWILVSFWWIDSNVVRKTFVINL